MSTPAFDVDAFLAEPDTTPPPPPGDFDVDAFLAAPEEPAPAAPHTLTPVEPLAPFNPTYDFPYPLEEADPVAPATMDTPELRRIHEAALLRQVFQQAAEAPNTASGTLQAVRDTLTQSNQDPEAWGRAHPELRRLVLEDPTLGREVVRSTTLGPIVRALARAWDAAWDANPADLMLDPRSMKPLRLPHEELQAQQAKQAEREARLDARDAARAQPRLVTEVDTPEARAVRDAQAQANKPVKYETLLDDASAAATRAKATWKAVSAGWNEAAAGQRVAEVSHRLLWATLNDEDTTALEADLQDAEREARPLYLGSSDDVRTLREVGSGLQSSLTVMGQSVVTGGEAATVAGLGTFALTKNPALATRVATAAGQVAGTHRAFTATAMLEAGPDFLEYRKQRLDDGTLMPPKVAAGAALVSGHLKGLIELGELGLQLKALGPVGEALRSGSSAPLRALLVGDSTFRRLVSRVGEAMAASGKAAGGEGGEEAAQQATGDVIGYLAQWSQQGLAAPPKRDVLKPEEAIEAGRQALASAAVMGMATASVHVATAARADSRAEASARQVPSLLELAQDDLTKANPAKVAALVEDATAGAGAPVTALHVDGRAALRYYQEAFPSPEEAAVAMAQDLGEGAVERIAEAAATGGRVTVPLTEALTGWAQSEAGKYLYQDTTTQPDTLTPNEVKAVREAAHRSATEEALRELAQAKDEAWVEERTAAFLQETVDTGRLSREKATAAGAVLRHFLATQAARFGKSAEELFDKVKVEVGLGDGQASTAQRLAQGEDVLPEDLLAYEKQLGDTKGDAGRRAALYEDDVSGLLTRQAWDETTRTPGTKVGVITVPDVKAVNDNPQGSHDVTNRLLALVANRLHGVDAGARVVARSGTDFLMEVKDEADLTAVIAKVQGEVPVGIRVLGFLGDDTEKAYAAEKRGTQALRDLPEGAPQRVLPRGDTAFDRSTLRDDSFEEPVARRPTPEALATKEPPRGADFVRQVLMDRLIPGVRSRLGFKAAGPKRFSASLDLRGLKNINKLADEVGTSLGWTDAQKKEWGDATLKAFGDAAMRAGGGQVFFAHLSGDEFAAKADSKEALEGFVEELLIELQRVRVPVILPGGRQTYIMPVFRHGIAEGSYGKADQQLNRDKSREPKLEPGTAADELRRAGALLEPGREDRGYGDAHPSPPTAPRTTGRDEGQAAGGTPGTGSSPGEAAQVAPGKGRLEQDAPGAPKGYLELPNAGTAEKVFRVFLNEKADVSTVLHETGHVFLELLGDLSARPDAPASVKADYAAVLQWMGVEGREGIQREHHERWARSFEAYLREGRAPARGLMGAFRRFATWLTAIYKTVASLNAPLSDDIRQVFDRMLATDREVVAARKAMGRPLWASAKEAGMSEAQWALYQAQQEDILARAAEKVRQRALREEREEAAKAWATAVREAARRAAQAYEMMKGRQAQHLLAGTLPGLKTAPVWLDRAAVDEAVGGWTSSFRTTETGGTHPDEVAALAGFPTGKAMLEAILTLPPKDAWVQATAEAEVAEKHPELKSPQARAAAAAQEELQGPTGEAVLLEEWRALTSGAGQMEPPIAALKRAARTIALGKRLSELHPGKVLQLEREAARKKAEAAARGRKAEAVEWARRQFLNMYLHQEVTQALKERQQYVALAKEMTRRAAIERQGKASPVYRDGVRLILESMGMVRPAAEAPRVSIQQVARLLVDDAMTLGEWVQPVEELVAARGNEAWDTLTVEDMRHVVEALHQLRAAVAHRTEVILDERKADVDDALDAIAKEAISNRALLPPSATESAQTVREKTGAGVSAVDGFLRAIPSLVLDLTGGDLHGAAFRLLVDPMRQAKYREAELLQRAVAPIIAAFEALPDDVRRRAMEPIDGRALFPEHTTKKAVPRRRFELYMMALNAGNGSNLFRLTEGRRITEAQVRGALDLLTKEELAWVQSIFDASEALKEESFALEERDSGLRPQAIEARPMQLKGGELRGGYFPAVYDREATNVGKRQEGDAMAAFFDSTFTRPGTAHGHTKERATNFSGVISLEPSSIYAHFAKVAHDIAFREVVKSVARLVMDERMQQLLRERLGPGQADAFLQWLKDIGGASQEHSVRAMKAYQWAKGNFAVAVLGNNAPVAAGDTFNLPTAIFSSDVKARHVAAAVLECAAKPAEMRAMALEKSGELRVMENDTQRHFAAQVQSLTAGAGQRVLNLAKYHAFFMQEVVSRLTATPVWVGAYRQALEEGQSEGDAVRFANHVLTTAFGSNSPVEKAGILRDKGWWGASTLFYGYFSVMYQAVAHQTRASRSRQYVEAATGLKVRTNVEAALGTVGLLTVAVVLPELLMGKGPSDDDKDKEEPDNALLKWRNWFLRKLMLAPLAVLPMGGEVAGAIEGGLQGKRVNPRASPLMGLAFQVMTTGKAVATAYREGGVDDGEKALVEALKLLCLAKGIPAYKLANATLPYLMDLIDGDAEPRGPFDAASGLLIGPKKDNPWTPLTAVQDAVGSDKKASEP